MAKHKDAETSIVWVREAQTGADSCRKDMDDKKLHVLPEINSVKPTSGSTDVARFGEAALEAAKKFFEDNKVID